MWVLFSGVLVKSGGGKLKCVLSLGPSTDADLLQAPMMYSRSGLWRTRRFDAMLLDASRKESVGHDSEEWRFYC
jgi:hypothetical protein